MTSDGSRAARRRGLLTAGSLAALALLGGASVATAGGAAAGAAVLRQPDGSMAIDGARLRQSYEGHELSAGQIRLLQRRHLAQVSVTNRETACHGVSLWFDTDAEANRYLAGVEARRPAGRVDATADPCAIWTAPLRWSPG